MEFLRFPCAESTIVELLRIPVCSDTPPSLVGNKVSGAPGAQNSEVPMHRNFHGGVSEDPCAH